MSSILERLKRTDAAMKNAAVNVQLGFKLKQQAINAMMGGIGSPEWKSYMSLFADNVEQLNRLTVPQDNEDSWLAEARAYIVANAICGADSTTQTSVRVDSDLDDSLSSNSDNSILDNSNGQPGEIVRPFVIP